jgi:phosphate uptake regulator
MGKRKVSLIGPSTLMVSLPSKWVKEFGVKKGDEINISENGPNLILESQKLKKGEPLEIDISGLNANLIRYNLYAAYRNGCDEIKLLFDEEKVTDINKKKKLFVMDVINSSVDNLIGIETMVHKSNYVLLKEISSVNREEFLNTLRRVFITLLNTSSDIAKGIEEKDKITLERIKEISDKKINRLCDFCTRIINKGGIVETAKVPQYYSIISILEEIGDSLEEVCELALGNKVNVNQVEMINELLDSLYRLFCEYKKPTLNEFYLSKNKIRDINVEGDLKIELSKIASCCSKIIPEIMSLNI